MLISNIINDSFGLLSKQLRFYCWHFRRNLDQRQRQELIELLYEQHFERLANKIKILNQSAVADCKQQVGKLLFEHCFTRNRRHQLIQLIESGLVDINVRLDNYGRTLLHRSAYNLDVELVRILIEHGVNIRLRDYAGNTALHIAIQSYRNGAVIYGNGPDVVQNLTSIIKLLLLADLDLQQERYKRKKIKLSPINDDDHGCNSGNHSMSRALDQSEQLDAVDKVESHQSPMNGVASIYSYSQRNKTDGDPIRLNHIKAKNNVRKLNVETQDQSNCTSDIEHKDRPEFLSKQTVAGQPENTSAATINPILLEDVSSPLVDTKNAFGRTALHYCVLVVGEQHLNHFVKLLISFGADVDAIDTRMKTPLYCLVKRPGLSEIRHKCLAITYLLDSGCDDLGLAIDPKLYFTEKFINHLEENVSSILQTKSESPLEPIFTHSTFQRIPSLKHIARLRLIRLQDEKNKLKRQTRIILPHTVPESLNLYMNKRILDQSELF